MHMPPRTHTRTRNTQHACRHASAHHHPHHLSLSPSLTHLSSPSLEHRYLEVVQCLHLRRSGAISATEAEGRIRTALNKEDLAHFSTELAENQFLPLDYESLLVVAALRLHGSTPLDPLVMARWRALSDVRTKDRREKRCSSRRSVGSHTMQQARRELPPPPRLPPPGCPPAPPPPLPRPPLPWSRPIRATSPRMQRMAAVAAVVAVAVVVVWMVLRRIIGLRSLAGRCGRSCAAGRRSLTTLVLVGVKAAGEGR